MAAYHHARRSHLDFRRPWYAEPVDRPPLEAGVADRLAMHRNADGKPHIQQLTGGRWVQSIRHRTPDGGIVVLRSDITAFKERERAAELLAQHDALTGTRTATRRETMCCASRPIG